MSTISCHPFICCHLSLLSQCSVIMVIHYPPSFLLVLLLSSLLTCFCFYIVMPSAYSWCLLPHGFCSLPFPAHVLWLLLPLHCWLSICSQSPLDKNLVDSLLTLVLLSRNFKSFCLISHGPDFSFVGRCPLVIQSALIRAEGTWYTNLKRM